MTGKSGFSRRALVQGLGALGLSSCAGQLALTGPFPLGVSSGDVATDGAVLWTRYDGGGRLEAVVWEGEDAALSQALRLPVTPDDGGFAELLVTGLSAGAWHSFVFEAFDGSGALLERSEVGRFRTALAANAMEPLCIGAVSCTKYGYSFAPLARAAEQADLDAFILLGDVVYADGAQSVADYRALWARNLGTPEYRALRQRTSVIAQWDDHEIVNNWSGDTVGRQLYDNALRAFEENQPLRLDAATPRRFWRKLSWGRTVDFFVLDSRTERDHAAGRYISQAQADWLVSGIAQSPATFKLVLNTVPIGSFDMPLMKPFNDDMWLGFPEQRAAILKGIDDSGARGVIWVSGDFHLACVGRVSREGPGATALEVLVGPGAQAANGLPSYPGPPQFDFSSGINNYTTFDLDPSSGVARIRYHDGRGRVFFDRDYTP